MGLVHDAKKKAADASVTDVDPPYKNLVRWVVAGIFVVLGSQYGSTAVIAAVTWFELELPVFADWMHAHAKDQHLATVLLAVTATLFIALAVFRLTWKPISEAPKWLSVSGLVSGMLTFAAMRFVFFAAAKDPSSLHLHRWADVIDGVIGGLTVVAAMEIIERSGMKRPES
jgi:hypothetical protein